MYMREFVWHLAWIQTNFTTKIKKRIEFTINNIFIGPILSVEVAREFIVNFICITITTIRLYITSGNSVERLMSVINVFHRDYNVSSKNWDPSFQ